jgi:hypothetical protein
LGYTLILAPTDLALQRTGTKEITLSWTDHSTIENGYVIERKQSPQTSFALLDTSKGSASQYVDKKVEQGQTYTYRIKAYINSAESDYSNEASLTVTVGVRQEEGVPTEYGVRQNYPNPFNPSTTISFSLPEASTVSLGIFNALGEEVAVLLSGRKEAGSYQAKWNAAGFPSGVYFYRFIAGSFMETKKLILEK